MSKATTKIKRPACVEDEHLEYLDNLRASGDVNVFGARPDLMRQFPGMDKRDAAVALKYWMDTFGNASR